MRELLADKTVKQNALAERMGISPAFISSLWKLGVGGKSLPAFVKLFKFANEKALRDTAYEWYRANEGGTTVRLQDPAFAEAVDIVVGLHPNVAPEQVRTIAYRFADPAFAGRDVAYWVRTLSEEVQIDYVRARQSVEDRRSAVREKAAEKRSAQSDWRQGHNLKAALTRVDGGALLGETTALVPPPPEKSIERPKRRKAR